MPIELTITANDNVPLDPKHTQDRLSELLPELSFSESENGSVKLEQMEAIGAKIPDVIRRNYETMTPRFQATLETEDSSFYVEFPADEEFESILVEVRGPNPFNEIIGRIIDHPNWVLRDPYGAPITSLD